MSKSVRVVDGFHPDDWRLKHISPNLRVEDLQILRGASRAGYHLVDVPLVMLFANWSERKARRRLEFLTKQKYLTRYHVPEFRQRNKLYPHIYEITRKGATVLKLATGAPSVDAYISSRKYVHPGYLLSAHTVELGRVRVVLERSALAMSGKLLANLDDRQLMPIFRGLGNVPDSFVHVQLASGSQAFFFVEHDRATMSNVVWQKRFRMYVELWLSGRFARDFAPNLGVGFRVLTTVPDMKRLNALRRWCLQYIGLADYRPMFCFALSREIEMHNAFTSAVWWRTDLEVPISLV